MVSSQHDLAGYLKKSGTTPAGHRSTAQGMCFSFITIPARDLTRGVPDIRLAGYLAPDIGRLPDIRLSGYPASLSGRIPDSKSDVKNEEKKISNFGQFFVFFFFFEKKKIYKKLSKIAHFS